MSTYQELLHYLNAHGFIASTVIEEKEYAGLEVQCPAIQSQPRLEQVRKVCGNDFDCWFDPNNEIISVKKK